MPDKTKTPNPNEFAKEVLWHLCGLQSAMQVVLHMMARERKEDINEADALYMEWMKGVGGIQKKLYDEALEKISLPR